MSNTITRALGAVAIAGTLAGAAYAGTAIGHADTPNEISLEYTTCSYLDSNPTAEGVVFVLYTMTDSGMTNLHAARVTANAIKNICPRHLDVAWDAIAQYS